MEKIECVDCSGREFKVYNKVAGKCILLACEDCGQILEINIEIKKGV